MADADRHVRPFVEWMLEVRKGKLAAELTTAMNELVEAVEAHGKGGKLTLTIDIAPAAKGATEMLKVTDNVTVKRPAADRSSSMYYVDDSKNLRRNDPRQEQFEIREVPPPAPAKDAAQEVASNG